MLRFLTAGESHGECLTVIIEGMPAGVPINEKFIASEMQKRQTGAGSGGRQLIEKDKVKIMSGVRFGQTLGSPISLQIINRDFINWEKTMAICPQTSKYRQSIRVVKPRPGHADLAGVQKYGFDDVRNVIERASARETAAKVAAGAIFKQFLLQFSIEMASHTVQIGNVRSDNLKYSFQDVKNSYCVNPEIRCLNRQTAKNMKEAIQKARIKKDTLGGIVEVWAVNVPVGLGSYVHYDRKIDGQIAQALMSIPSVKAVEIGEGLANSSQYGSSVHDTIYFNNQYYRKTNNAGGIEGGVTNGMPIIVRVFHKPISTLYKPLGTINLITKKPDTATVERSDICIVPRGGVVSEAMLSFVITRAMLEKFGCDNLPDIIHSYNHYLARIGC